MKKARCLLILAMIAVVLGFAGCATTQVSDVDPFKGTTWGRESVVGIVPEIKFKDDGTVIWLTEKYTYKVYRKKDSYQAQTEQTVLGGAGGGVFYFNLYDNKPDELLLVIKGSRLSAIGSFGMDILPRQTYIRMKDE